MSGHSKWANIKHKKGAADAKRGKIFTKHAKLIAIAARDGGGDPDMNPGLRTAIANAKADNVPNANIDKAIKKGTGEDKEGTVFVEAMYEGFGPLGTAIYVHAITDNKNRAVSNIKTCFAKNGGNMGESGSVGWMFKKKGLIVARAEGKAPESAELEIIDAGADDLEFEDGFFEIYTNPSELMEVREKLEGAGFNVEKASFDFVPDNTVKIESVEDATRVLKLIDALEDDEDVANVYGNFDISEEILNQI